MNIEQEPYEPNKTGKPTEERIILARKHHANIRLKMSNSTFYKQQTLKVLKDIIRELDFERRNKVESTIREAIVLHEIVCREGLRVAQSEYERTRFLLDTALLQYRNNEDLMQKVGKMVGPIHVLTPEEIRAELEKPI